MIRCHECGVEGRDEGLFRTYYPSVSDPPQRFCPSCWRERERANQRAGHVVIAGLVVAALLAATVFDLGETSLMARLVLFILGFNLLAIVLHELGHAGAALLAGMRVHQISFGYGVVLHSWTIGRTSVQVRSYPTCGFVVASGRSRVFARARHAFLALAGPATNVGMLVLGLWGLGGGWRLGDVPGLEGVTHWHILFGVNAIVIVMNLFPLAFPPEEGSARWQPNDGLMTLQAIFASQDRVTEWTAAAVHMEARELIDAGDSEGARALLEDGLATAPGSPLLRLIHGRLLLRLGDGVRARESLEAVAEDASQSPLARAEALGGLACALLLLGEEAEADRRSREALDLAPDSAQARYDRAVVALNLGWVQQAEDLARGAQASSADLGFKASCARLLARARLAAGDAEGARNQEELARKLDPESRALLRDDG